MLLFLIDLIRACRRLSQIRWFCWSFLVTNSSEISHLKQIVIHAIGLSICCLVGCELMSLIVTDNGPDWLQLRADRPRLRHLGIVDWRLPERPACRGRRELQFPLVIWTGLAMSPAFNSAVPNVLGERHSERGLISASSTSRWLFGWRLFVPSEIRFQWEGVYASQG